MIRTTSWRRALVAGTAAASALALAAPAAGAASTTHDFTGAADAQAFDLVVSDPLGLLTQVTGNEAGLQQKVSLTSAKLATTGDVAATATLLEGLLNDSIASGEQTSSRKAIVDQKDVAGILSVTAGLMEFDTSPTRSASKSQLAELRVSVADALAGTASDVVPAEVAEEVQSTVDQAVETVEGLVGELNGVLETIEETVTEATGQEVELPDVAVSELPALDLRQLLATDLVLVKKLWADTVVETKADVVESVSKAGIVEASLLGGLVRVPEFAYTSVARTNGQPGGAFADATVSTLAVQVADQTIVEIGDGGELSVGGVSVDLGAIEGVSAEELLGEVEAILTSIVNAAGLETAAGEEKEFAAADGSRAEASTSAFTISLAPLNALTSVLGEQAAAAQELRVSLALLPTNAVVAAAPIPAPKPPASEPNLPRTGGGAIAILFGGLAMAGAMGLRRRG